MNPNPRIKGKNVFGVVGFEVLGFSVFFLGGEGGGV